MRRDAPVQTEATGSMMSPASASMVAAEADSTASPTVASIADHDSSCAARAGHGTDPRPLCGYAVRSSSAFPFPHILKR